MAILKANIITPYVLDWLERSTAVSLLHLFDQACNVMNQLGEVVSIVAPSIGPGPFAIVVRENHVGRLFEGKLIRIDGGQFFVGKDKVDLRDAEVWQPQLDWNALRANQHVWRKVIPQIEAVALCRRQVNAGIETAVSFYLHQIESQLVQAISTQNRAGFNTAVSKIAGLGSGLTPAGDDFLVGVLYGLFAMHPAEEVEPWAEIVLETAVSRTTTLSAAWLRAAARGEAVVAWHEFGKQFVVHSDQWETAVHRILAIGHSSGADALAGFTAVTKIIDWK